jgi:hypothetical protein
VNDRQDDGGERKFFTHGMHLYGVREEHEKTRKFRFALLTRYFIR